ncbi:phage tail protein [Streptomyces adustus]|uniref:phage tail protein n=1 Tax=Streptomyces adustus TaxID=1609272 RepID=UPI00371AD0C1
MKAVPDKKTSAKTGAPPARPAAPAQTQARPAVEADSPTTAAGPEAAPPAGLGPQQVRLLQARAGNAAVARLVAQRQTAAPPATNAPAPSSAEAPAPPVKPPPSASPAFQGLKSEVRAKKTAASRHAPAAAESKAAQDAAVAPPDDKQAQGKAAQAEKMNAAKPGTFDKAAFVAAVNQAIAAQAPKNLDEADHFSGSGKAAAVKDQVSGQVSQGKAASAKEIDATTKAAPDLSKAQDKPVTPLTPDAPPPVPGTPNPAGAVPARQPDAVTDFSGGPRQINEQMADAEVTEDQLAKSNEPQFTGALAAKKEGEQHSAAAPGQARGAEAKQLAAAKQGAAAAGAQAMTGLAAARTATGKQVDGGKSSTKSADERRRAEVTARLQKVFDGTKTDVEGTLSGLDKLVDERFTAGEKAARDAFMADQKRRMDAYKDKRYSGWSGKLKWVKDKFAGLPAEANALFQESRKLYVAQMQQVISSIADLIGTELGKAKDRIARGRAELRAEVDKLPADLKKFGSQAAKDFTEKFDGLDADVNAKSDQLVQDLAQKYTQALNSVDDEIKKLQEENKGLIAKAKDAVVGVIQTIIELKNLLLGVLAKAASAVMKIIKDPIGFLSNLVSAVGAGLRQFVGNIAEHLKKGLVSWLLGAAAGAGLTLPAKFDLKGIIQLLAGLLGLTWGNIRARITRKGVPDQAVTAAEQSVPVAQAIQKEGPAGAVEHIKESVGDLKSTILQKLTSYLIPTVIVAGISWIVSLLTPASAFVRAVKGIIDIVTFVVTQGGQIIQFVNSILDAVVAIANGGGGGVPALIEGALAASIPVLLGFLASLLGIGNLAGKVRQVFTAVAKPVNKAIDKIVDFIAKAAKKLWGKLKGKFGKDKGKADKPGDHTEVETPRHLMSGGMFHLTETSPEFNAELGRARSGQVIHQTGGDPKQVTKSLLAEHSDARYDRPSGTLKLPKATVGAPSSLSELGAEVAAATGVSKVEVHRNGGTVQFVGGINPTTPVGGATAPPTDEEAVRAAISHHTIIKFLEGMASGSPLSYKKDGATYTVDMSAFERAWNDAPTRNWVKERFRGVLDGTHEWLPCEHIIAVIHRQTAANVAQNGQKWIDLQNGMRSPTQQVVYDPGRIPPKRVTERQPDGSSRQYSVPQGHVGAVYYPTVDSTSQQVVGRGRFHRALGDAFKSSTTPEGAAQAAYNVALEWVWDGTSPISPDIHPLCRDKDHNPVTGARQQANIAAIHRLFAQYI